MRTYSVSRVIHAPPPVVWRILTDPATLSNGTFSIRQIDGRIQDGATITLISDVDPNRSFAIKVTDMVPNQSMSWSSGLPLGLFRGTRRFTLTPEDTGTRFDMREAYTGPLAGLMFRVIPNLQPSFETFADALKAHAERSAR